MSRRIFIAVASFLSLSWLLRLFGIGTDDEWCSEAEISQGLRDLSKTSASPVFIGDIDCGAGTCPRRGKDFRAHVDFEKHHYAITVKENYLGCVVENRVPSPGEDWLRGRDLADGRRTRKTWARIMRDIRSRETASVYKPLTKIPTPQRRSRATSGIVTGIGRP